MQLEIIFAADPSWLESFSQLAENERRISESSLIQATDLLSQYPPLAYAIDVLDAIQDELMTLALYARALGSENRESHLWPPNPPKVKELDEILNRRYDRYMKLFINESAIGHSARKDAFRSRAFIGARNRELGVS